jgi:hypothetical protein
MMESSHKKLVLGMVHPGPYFVDQNPNIHSQVIGITPLSATFLGKTLQSIAQIIQVRKVGGMITASQ